MKQTKAAPVGAAFAGYSFNVGALPFRLTGVHQRLGESYRPRPSGFVAPCLPTLSRSVPSGPRRVHEIKQAAPAAARGINQR